MGWAFLKKLVFPNPAWIAETLWVTGDCKNGIWPQVLQCFRKIPTYFWAHFGSWMRKYKMLRDVGINKFCVWDFTVVVNMHPLTLLFGWQE